MRRPLLLVLLFVILGAPALAAQHTVTPRTVSLRIGGRLQTQYASSSVASHNDGFFLRRGRILVDATFNDFIDARVQSEFVGSSVGLRDAYLRLRFSPEFQLTMGQFKRAFDPFELDSSTDLSIIERDARVSGVDSCAGVGGVCSYSRFMQKLALSDRDVGIRLAGSLGRAEYQLSMTNGTAANRGDENDTKSYAGRVTVGLSDRVTIGGQVALHDYVEEDDGNAYAPAWAADLQYGGYRDGLLVKAALASGENWKNVVDDGTASTFRAFQAIASYYFARPGERLVGVEPLLRVTQGDPDTDLGNDGGAVFTPGLMFYVYGKNKIGFNVDIWSPQVGDSEYSLKFQSFLYF